MAGNTRTFTIEFVSPGLKKDSNVKVDEVLSTIKTGSARSFEQGSFTFELRDIETNSKGDWRGVLAKFRTVDIPHAALIGGKERDLGLAEDEGLIEKNYFLYNAQLRVFAFQRNGHGGTPRSLARCLSDVANETITLNPVIQSQAMKRLMSDDVEPISLALSIARPTNPDMFPKDNWTKDLLALMNESGASRMHVRVSADRRSKAHADHSLADTIKGTVLGILDFAKVAKVKVVEDGEVSVIDLITDRLISEQEVDIRGRYPVGSSMYGALHSAILEQTAEIKAVLGEPGHRLN